MLERATANHTRLLVRLRLDYAPRLPVGIACYLLLEPIRFVMERGMLVGIRRRAEGIGSHVDRRQAPEVPQTTPDLRPAPARAEWPKAGERTTPRRERTPL